MFHVRSGSETTSKSRVHSTCHQNKYLQNYDEEEGMVMDIWDTRNGGRYSVPTYCMYIVDLCIGLEPNATPIWNIETSINLWVPLSARTGDLPARFRFCQCK